MKYSAFIDAGGILAGELDFLAKSIGSTVINPAMTYIHIEPSDKGEGLLGIATDGRRLHLVDPLPESLLEGIQDQRQARVVSASR